MSATMRAPTDRIIRRILKDAKVTHHALEEDVSPQDWSDDPDTIRFVRELAKRTPWGWCTVRTDMEWCGYTASTYLGCCSFESHDDFAQCEGDTQAREACFALIQQLYRDRERGKRASTILRAIAKL